MMRRRSYRAIAGIIYKARGAFRYKFYSEPEKLREKKAELAKTEKPRGTTGIAINDRITWWQKMGKKSDVKTSKKAKKAKKEKKKRKGKNFGVN